MKTKLTKLACLLLAGLMLLSCFAGCGVKACSDLAAIKKSYYIVIVSSYVSAFDIPSADFLPPPLISHQGPSSEGDAVAVGKITRA